MNSGFLSMYFQCALVKTCSVWAAWKDKQSFRTSHGRRSDTGTERGDFYIKASSTSLPLKVGLRYVAANQQVLSQLLENESSQS